MMKRPPIRNVVRFMRAPRGMRGGLMTPQQLAQTMRIGERPQGINPLMRKKSIKAKHRRRGPSIRKGRDGVNNK